MKLLSQTFLVTVKQRHAFGNRLIYFLRVDARLLAVLLDPIINHTSNIRAHFAGIIFPITFLPPILVSHLLCSSAELVPNLNHLKL